MMPLIVTQIYVVFDDSPHIVNQIYFDAPRIVNQISLVFDDVLIL